MTSNLRIEDLRHKKSSITQNVFVYKYKIKGIKKLFDDENYNNNKNKCGKKSTNMKDR